jgi:hypothetical protein
MGGREELAFRPPLAHFPRCWPGKIQKSAMGLQIALSFDHPRKVRRAKSSPSRVWPADLTYSRMTQSSVAWPDEPIRHQTLVRHCQF